MTDYSTRTTPTSSYTERTPIQTFDYITWDEAIFTWDSTAYTWNNSYTGYTVGTNYNTRPNI